MNRFAYRTTSLAIKMLSSLSKAKINIHGKENIPEGSIIFVINHFTRIETLLLPYHINNLTGMPVWSLAAYELFKGALGTLLDKIGAVSTKDPDRDLLIVKSLLTGEALWIFFPEGLMVKSKKIIDKGRFMITSAGEKRPPHTGAATLALRTEFYRQRLLKMSESVSDEARRLMDLFQIDSLESVLEKKTYIVPINITYYPIRTRENILSNLAVNLVEDIPERMVEEIMTEGTMLLSGVDVDMRFGEPIEIKEYLQHSVIKRDISATSRINFNDPIPSIKRMRKEAQNIMQRYMSAIYNMTTVNHDHLFASMLRMIPFKKIKAHDLRRRVFLSVTGKFNKNGVFLHNTMKENQLDLLTDDRFNRFKNFSSVAIESGFVKEKEEMLVKDTAKISFDFHRIRIDNPVEVIANEVEPLTSLQRRIRRLAREPGFWIRHKIARRLMKKAILEFEEDYKTYYIDGESKKKDIGMPFLIKGSSREMGVVLFHGYMAAPLEVKELAKYLGRRGFWVYVPRIKGHGTSPEDLATRKYTDWMESVDEGYAVISNLCRRVVAGGFSNGAGLALDLTARIEDMEGVFTVCPPLRLKDFSSKFVPALDFWNKFMDKVHIDSGQKEFVENNPENPHINYLRNPISGLRELERLMDSVESKLSAIQAPTLVIQSYGDPVVDQTGSRKVFELLGSEDKSYILFNFDRHGILLGDGAHRVHKAIADFIDHLR